jgi:hypothetical protein
LRTNACGFDRGVDGGVATHHDDGHIEQSSARPFFQQGHAIGVGHPNVQQHQIGPGRLACKPRLCGVFCNFYCMTFVVEDLKQQVPNAQFVIHHQNVCHV